MFICVQNLSYRAVNVSGIRAKMFHQIKHTCNTVQKRGITKLMLAELVLQNNKIHHFEELSVFVTTIQKL